MIDFKSYVNDLEIIHSGQAHLVENNIFKMIFDDVKIEVTFISDMNMSTGQITWKVEEAILKISLINYKSIFGSGVFEPWLIGDYKGKNLYMTFLSKYIENNSANYFVFDYIFYVGKEAINAK
jgi:hypothetical protein